MADLLTVRGEVPPAHFLLVHPERRGRDYIFHEPFRAHVLQELLPAAEARVNCDGRRILLGASLGALAGADLALDRPDLFTAVAAHSGAFLIAPDDDPPDPFAGGEWLLRQLRAGRGRGLRWHLECGTLEWLLPCHRRLEAALQAAGGEHRAVERHVGHNWVNWRQALPGTLRSVLAD